MPTEINTTGSTNCTPEAGWQFKLSTDENQTLNPTTTATTDATGRVNVPFSSLQTDQQGALASGGQLWVSEVPQNNVATLEPYDVTTMH